MYRIASQVFSLFLLVWVLFSCKSPSEPPTLPYYNTPDFSPLFLTQADDIAQKVPHKIADFSFINQHGAVLNEEAIDGKIHVANFIFTTCPSICPIMTEHVKALQEVFANDPEFAILSYSVTPWIDDVEQLARYTQSQDIHASNWHFLTGEKAEIYQLARTSYFAEEDIGYTKDSTEFLHTEHILLVDKSRRIRGIYNGTLQLEIKQLIEDIRVLKR